MHLPDPSPPFREQPSSEQPPFCEEGPFREPRPSRDELIVTEALRRRALAVARRCLPAIIREARYEELDELIDLFRWFGSPEAMQLEAPEGHTGTPGLTLQEANALIHFRRQRRQSHASPGAAAAEIPPPAPEITLPAPWLATPPSPPAPARVAACLATPPRAPKRAKAAPPATSGLHRVFRNGQMWFVDPETGKIVSPAPP